MSRTTETREYNERSEIYKPGSELDLPPAIVEHFESQGLHLRWVRFNAAGLDDARNVSKRMREGWEFVMKKDLPEGFSEMFDSAKIRGNMQVVCVGDLILAKIPVAKVKARQKYYEDLTNQRTQTARAEARTNPDPRMSRMVPVEDESKTEIKDFG